MAAANGDLIQCVDNQSYLGQQVLNVYYFRINAPLGIADPYLSDLNDSFTLRVLNVVVDIQNSLLEHVSREWRNLSNGVDLFTDATVVEGSNSATETTALPSYVSVGFMLNRDSLVTRNGYKRFAGLTDGDVAGNTYLGGAPTIAAVEAALTSSLNIGLAEVAYPIIVKRPINPPVATYDYSSVASAQFRTVGTQNSRKAGRGV